MMTTRYGPAVAAVLPILLASSAVAHAQTPESKQELRGSIRIVGTDTMKELMDRWIAGFTAIHPEVRIELAAKGALTAAPALSDGSADLATLGREFTPSEIAGFHAKRPYAPTGIRVAIGSYDSSGKTVALAFFVNQANPIARLNFEQLDAHLLQFTPPEGTPSDYEMGATRTRRGVGEPRYSSSWRQLPGRHFKLHQATRL
jgi:ABC-type phosphate transport system substrate-binding protein